LICGPAARVPVRAVPVRALPVKMLRRRRVLAALGQRGRFGLVALPPAALVLVVPAVAVPVRGVTFVVDRLGRRHELRGREGKLCGGDARGEPERSDQTDGRGGG